MNPLLRITWMSGLKQEYYSTPDNKIKRHLIEKLEKNELIQRTIFLETPIRIEYIQ
jgi:hypothetical protein